jgi:hypothetical protein
VLGVGGSLYWKVHQRSNNKSKTLTIARYATALRIARDKTTLQGVYMDTIDHICGTDEELPVNGDCLRQEWQEVKKI